MGFGTANQYVLLLHSIAMLYSTVILVYDISS